MSYLRISTHPGIFSKPLSPGEALDNIEAILALPRVRLIREEDGFMTIYKNITARFPVRGNLVPDAHLAALLRQHDIQKIYSNDMDFKKFDFLEVISIFEQR